MIKIRLAVIESIVMASQNTFPDEFISLLGVDREGIISELVVLPAVFGSNFSSVRMDLVPFDRKVIGSIHSHPSHNNRPSQGDLHVFSRMGKVHFIICMPFNLNSLKAYNVKGLELPFEVIE
ncbi:MAG: Mov34/MPN/PAD-1 family protein [Candidatus Diapherotrites archaeon]